MAVTVLALPKLAMSHLAGFWPSPIPLEALERTWLIPASTRNNLLPITWDHICFLHGCHAHPGTASAHLSPVTSKC